MSDVPLDPARLTADELARLLSGPGRVVSVGMITSDIADGAPTNDDGTLHLMHYAAWLTKEAGRRGV